jgi:hypothetical protein
MPIIFPVWRVVGTSSISLFKILVLYFKTPHMTLTWKKDAKKALLSVCRKNMNFLREKH